MTLPTQLPEDPDDMLASWDAIGQDPYKEHRDREAKQIAQQAAMQKSVECFATAMFNVSQQLKNFTANFSGLQTPKKQQDRSNFIPLMRGIDVRHRVQNSGTTIRKL
jgi:hypothetical protein